MKICLCCEGVAPTDLLRCAHCGVVLLPVESAHFPTRRSDAEAANALLGAVIDGKYQLQGVLGRGGMGTVFRASHAVSLAPLAVKLMHPRLSSRPEHRRGLLAEARRAGRVVHERCARIFDVGETPGGAVYLAMELAEGESLDVWARGHRIEPELAVVVLRQICEALIAIHGAGLVHRDLSARNVMVADRDGSVRVKVLDFGIAQSLQRQSAVGEEHGGAAVFANPVFSAPEQLAGSQVDARADLYSFGVLAYFLLSGRLPVEAVDAAAAAKATLAAELAPLQTPRPLPRRLQRLVEACLQRDPARRPASARACLLELDATVRGRLPWLPRASVALLALSASALLWVTAQATPPFLRVVGGALALEEGDAIAGARIQHQRPEALQTLRLVYGGFAPRRLELEIEPTGALPWRAQLLPRIDGDGVLALDQASESWQKALVGITRASADGPVELRFVAPGTSLLMGARLVLDGAPPKVGVALDPPEPVLRAGTKLQVELEEAGGIAALQAEVRLLDQADGAQPHRSLRLDLDPEARSVALDEALSAAGLGLLPLGRAELEVLAVDRAGNRGASAVLLLDAVDLGAPFVEDATGPAGEATIPYVESHAQLRVQLSHGEPGVRFEAWDSQRRSRLVGDPLELDGGWHELQLAAAASGEPFEAGLYTLVTQDRAGNRQMRVLPLAFRARRLDAVFTPAPGGGIVVHGDGLVAPPAGGVVAFTCSREFVPIAARLRPADAAANVELHRGPTQWQVAVSGLQPGPHQLVLQLEEGGERPGVVEYVTTLMALPETVAVRWPDGGGRYLQGLLQGNVLASDGVWLRQGAGVQLDGDLRPFVRGRVWFGPDPMALAPQPIAEEGRSGPLLPPLRLLRGRNVIALELRDALGRDVQAFAGERRADTIEQDGVQMAVLADFFDDPGAPQTVADELQVEHGQDLLLRLRCPLPFAAADLPRLLLVVQAREHPALTVRRFGPGSEIAFLLPFASWREASGLGELGREDYAAGATAQLPFRLVTPAGGHALTVRLRTARSTLRVLPLREAALRPLPSALGALRLAPALAPASGTWPDPVPRDEPTRGLYRGPFHEPIRGMEDFFVFEREMTRGQYAELLSLLPEATSASLVHADDPLQAARLWRPAMTPAGLGGDAEAFLQWVQAAPDAPATGLDFFQCYAASRLLGLVVGDDPELFRLPLGCELELAALGREPKLGARHGAAARGGRATTRPYVLGREDAAAVGMDAVQIADGVTAFGLDFGVREWTLDLAVFGDSSSLLLEWTGDRLLHLQRALALAGAGPQAREIAARLPGELLARLRGYGVVRGIGAGERHGLIDRDGQPVDVEASATLPPETPGVVRVELLRRDGRDLMPDRLDPRLSHTGFRLVGDTAFVRWVRAR